MTKSEFINKIQEMREEGENDLRAVLHFAKQLDEPSEVRVCELVNGYNCSICGVSQADIRKKYSNFCSNCGAKIKRN